MEIVVLPALSDNYMYLICADAEAVIVDPAAEDPVMRELDKRGLTLTRILITHHHYDHVQGVPGLCRHTNAEVIGPNDERIPGLKHPVREGNTFAFAGSDFRVLDTPGHGDRDVSYLLRTPGRPDALFCGDTLFVSGCGRVLEGSAEALWTSLRKLAALPDETRVYCGHEYTEENLRFALTVDPHDRVYQDSLTAAQQRLRDGLPTVPSTIGTEKKANPFLRCDSSVAFTALRKRKDRF